MPRKNHLFLRGMAAALIGAFLLQEISYGAPVLSLVRPAGYTALETVPLDPSQLETPVDFASLKEAHKGTNGKLIIHIQDAHANFSGQENLAGALDELMTKYKIPLVLSEGGAKDCSLTPLRDIAPAPVWKRIARSYLLQGKLSGEEYLNLTSDHPMKIIGIEDLGLYLKSVRSYAQLAQQRENTLSYLALIQRGVDKLKNKLYPGELLEYEKTAGHGPWTQDKPFEESFKTLFKIAREHKVDLLEFGELEKLIELTLKEALIDFNLANLEQASLMEEIQKRGGGDNLQEELSRFNRLKDQKRSQLAYFEKTLSIAGQKGVLLEKYPHLLQYREYLKAFSGIDLEKMMDELEKAEDKVYAAVIASADLPADALVAPGAKQSMLADQFASSSATEHWRTPRNDQEIKDILLVRSIDRYLGLLDVAYRIQMTTKDFNFFKANEPDFATAAYLAFLNRKLAEQGYFEDLIPMKNVLEDGKGLLEAFYDSVEKRDHAFLENTEKALREEDQKAAFLISGGYHTSHLKKLLREKGYSFVVLSPIVTSETNRAKYEKRLLEPLESGTKKAVAKDLRPAAGKTDGVRQLLLGVGFTDRNGAVSSSPEEALLVTYSQRQLGALREDASASGGPAGKKPIDDGQRSVVREDKELPALDGGKALFEFFKIFLSGKLFQVFFSGQGRDDGDHGFNYRDVFFNFLQSLGNIRDLLLYVRQSFSRGAELAAKILQYGGKFTVFGEFRSARGWNRVFRHARNLPLGFGPVKTANPNSAGALAPASPAGGRLADIGAMMKYHVVLWWRTSLNHLGGNASRWVFRSNTESRRRVGKIRNYLWSRGLDYKILAVVVVGDTAKGTAEPGSELRYFLMRDTKPDDRPMSAEDEIDRHVRKEIGKLFPEIRFSDGPSMALFESVKGVVHIKKGMPMVSTADIIEPYIKMHFAPFEPRSWWNRLYYGWKADPDEVPQDWMVLSSTRGGENALAGMIKTRIRGIERAGSSTARLSENQSSPLAKKSETKIRFKRPGPGFFVNRRNLFLFGGGGALLLWLALHGKKTEKPNAFVSSDEVWQSGQAAVDLFRKISGVLIENFSSVEEGNKAVGFLSMEELAELKSVLTRISQNQIALIPDRSVNTAEANARLNHIKINPDHFKLLKKDPKILEDIVFHESIHLMRRQRASYERYESLAGQLEQRGTVDMYSEEENKLPMRIAVLPMQDEVEAWLLTLSRRRTMEPNLRAYLDSAGQNQFVPDQIRVTYGLLADSIEPGGRIKIEELIWVAHGSSEIDWLREGLRLIFSTQRESYSSYKDWVIHGMFAKYHTLPPNIFQSPGARLAKNPLNTSIAAVLGLHAVLQVPSITNLVVDEPRPSTTEIMFGVLGEEDNLEFIRAQLDKPEPDLREIAASMLDIKTIKFNNVFGGAVLPRYSEYLETLDRPIAGAEPFTKPEYAETLLGEALELLRRRLPNDVFKTVVEHVRHLAIVRDPSYLYGGQALARGGAILVNISSFQAGKEALAGILLHEAGHNMNREMSPRRFIQDPTGVYRPEIRVMDQLSAYLMDNLLLGNRGFMTRHAMDGRLRGLYSRYIDDPAVFPQLGNYAQSLATIEKNLLSTQSGSPLTAVNRQTLSQIASEFARESRVEFLDFRLGEDAWTVEYRFEEKYFHQTLNEKGPIGDAIALEPSQSWFLAANPNPGPDNEYVFRAAQDLVDVLDNFTGLWILDKEIEEDPVTLRAFFDAMLVRNMIPSETAPPAPALRGAPAPASPAGGRLATERGESSRPKGARLAERKETPAGPKESIDAILSALLDPNAPVGIRGESFDSLTRLMVDEKNEINGGNYRLFYEALLRKMDKEKDWTDVVPKAIGHLPYILLPVRGTDEEALEKIKGIVGAKERREFLVYAYGPAPTTTSHGIILNVDQKTDQLQMIRFRADPARDDTESLAGLDVIRALRAEGFVGGYKVIVFEKGETLGVAKFGTFPRLAGMLHSHYDRSLTPSPGDRIHALPWQMIEEGSVSGPPAPAWPAAGRRPAGGRLSFDAAAESGLAQDSPQSRASEARQGARHYEQLKKISKLSVNGIGADELENARPAIIETIETVRIGLIGRLEMIHDRLFPDDDSEKTSVFESNARSVDALLTMATEIIENNLTSDERNNREVLSNVEVILTQAINVAEQGEARIREAAYDTRPVEAGIISEGHALYDRRVLDSLNPSGRKITVLYGAAGGDLVNLFLSLNPSKVFMVGRYSDFNSETFGKFLKDPSLKNRLLSLQNRLLALNHSSQTADGIIARTINLNALKNLDSDLVVLDYLAAKYRLGFGLRRIVDHAPRTFYAILAYELFALGVSLDTVVVTEDDGGNIRISFPWGHGAGKETPREVTFIDADVVKDYQRYLGMIPGDINVYYQRAAMQVPFSYFNENEFLKFISRKMSRRGYFVTDDHVSYENRIDKKDLSTDFPEREVGVKRVHLGIPQSFKDSIHRMAANFAPVGSTEYGWGMTIRQRATGAPARPAGARLADHAKKPFAGSRLLRQPFIQYEMAVRNVINPRGRPVKYLNGAAGVAVSDFLLTTDADKGYFVALYSRLSEQDLKRAFMNPRRIMEGQIEIERTYRRIKFVSGYGHQEAMRTKDSVLVSLVLELKALGIDLRNIRVATDGYGNPSIEFPWAYPGETEKTRTIVFIDGRLENPDSYLRFLPAKIDGYYQKGITALPAIYDRYIPRVAERMRKNGFFVTDNVGNPWDETKKETIPTLLANYTGYFKNFKRFKIPNEPKLISAVYPRLKFLQNELLLSYGWRLTIHQNKEGAAGSGAPARPAGGRLSKEGVPSTLRAELETLQDARIAGIRRVIPFKDASAKIFLQLKFDHQGRTYEAYGIKGEGEETAAARERMLNGLRTRFGEVAASFTELSLADIRQLAGEHGVVASDGKGYGWLRHQATSYAPDYEGEHLFVTEYDRLKPGDRQEQTLFTVDKETEAFILTERPGMAQIREKLAGETDEIKNARARIRQEAQDNEGRIRDLLEGHQALRVLQLNIQNAGVEERADIQAAIARHKQLFERIKLLGEKGRLPHIITLNEVLEVLDEKKIVTYNAAEVLAQLLGYQVVLSQEKRMDGQKSLRERSAILVAPDMEFIGEPVESFSQNDPIVAALVRSKKGGREILVVTAHLAPFPWQTVGREKQVQEIRRVIKSVDREGVLPVLVSGDFNFASGGEIAKNLKVLDGFMDPYPILNPGSRGETFSLENNPRVGYPGRRLDFTWANGYFKPLYSQPVLEDEPLSDHFGLQTDLFISDEAAARPGAPARPAGGRLSFDAAAESGLAQDSPQSRASEARRGARLAGQRPDETIVRLRALYGPLSEQELNNIGELIEDDLRVLGTLAVSRGLKQSEAYALKFRQGSALVTAQSPYRIEFFGKDGGSIGALDLTEAQIARAHADIDVLRGKPIEQVIAAAGKETPAFAQAASESRRLMRLSQTGTPVVVDIVATDLFTTEQPEVLKMVQNARPSLKKNNVFVRFIRPDGELDENYNALSDALPAGGEYGRMLLASEESVLKMNVPQDFGLLLINKEPDRIIPILPSLGTAADIKRHGKSDKVVQRLKVLTGDPLADMSETAIGFLRQIPGDFAENKAKYLAENYKPFSIQTLELDLDQILGYVQMMVKAVGAAA